MASPASRLELTPLSPGPAALAENAAGLIRSGDLFLDAISRGDAPAPGSGGATLDDLCECVLHWLLLPLLASELPLVGS